MAHLRQPRLAEIIAAQLREDILSGRLKEGDLLASQARLFDGYQVSPPVARETLRILETEGLISVRRGNVGGAIVHSPTPERAAQMIAMVLQKRETSPQEVSIALRHLEPICAGLCASREDRAETVVPVLRELVEQQWESLEDMEAYLRLSRDFHSSIVSFCGNEPMIVVIGALQAIWSAHDSLVWETIADGADTEADPSAPLGRKTRRAALRTHEKLVNEIEQGNSTKATSLAAAHLSASHTNTLQSSEHETIRASLVSAAALDVPKASPAR
ncbi:FadR/GntR family transcriptional regulator [Actinomadura rugatobispora]|uniref:FadR/GntR family transcriptional regulator n=1 Tax=Actinomadura rugatobispora TaxID=1994 RepID=A0ABW1A7X1_9ACTN